MKFWLSQNLKHSYIYCISGIQQTSTKIHRRTNQEMNYNLCYIDKQIISLYYAIDLVSSTNPFGAGNVIVVVLRKEWEYKSDYFLNERFSTRSMADTALL